MTGQRFVPVSVRYGNRRRRLVWWLKGRREALAVRLAPWLMASAITSRRMMSPADHAALDEFLDSHSVERGGYTVVAMDGAATVTLNDGFLLLQVSDYRAEESAAIVLEREQALYLSRALAHLDEEERVTSGDALDDHRDALARYWLRRYRSYRGQDEGEEA